MDEQSLQTTEELFEEAEAAEEAMTEDAEDEVVIEAAAEEVTTEDLE